MLELDQIIELSKNDNHKTEITIDKVVEAKRIIAVVPKDNKELFQVLASMNLINAALKRKEFKSKEKDALIHYGMLKPRVSKIFHLILDNPKMFEIDFYINSEEKCAYIEIEGLQFSFHNITIDESLKTFINSLLNIPQPWKGIRLQKIGGELFDYALNKKEVLI